VDAKGPLAAFTDAAARVGPLPGWQTVVIGAVEEERDSQGARYVKDQYQPEFAIIGEPSGWERVTLGYKGSAWAEVRLRAAQAHSAHQAQNAAEVAFEAWGLVREWCAAFNAGRQRAFDQALPTLRGLASGEDGFETWASLRLGVRLPPDLPPQAWYTQLDQTLGVLKTLRVSVELERLGYAIPAYPGEKNTPLVRALLAGIRAAGGEPGFVRKTGTADLNIVAPAWGCPAAAYGPGDSALDHTPDEHIDLGEYGKAVEALAEAISRLCR
jgi:LysW-gamma-L-lysine carboxypeptidase